MCRSSLFVNLTELPLRVGDHYERVHPFEPAPIVLGGRRHDVLPADGVTVKVDRVAGGFLVSVALKAAVYGPCVRCLREAIIEVEVEEQEFAPTAGRDESPNDLSPFIEHLVVDVAGMAREAVVLGLPNRILCSDECRGLCAYCGQDLNTASCGCGSAKADERWAVLRGPDPGD